MPRGSRRPSRNSVVSELELSRIDQEIIDSRLDLIEERVTAHGYPLNVHTVETADGYFLTVHHIPYSPVNKDTIKDRRPVVLLQHGLLGSSYDWILQEPGKALAYILADRGYDVWMGNSRGNTFSRSHKSFDVQGKQFWRFSFHEIGYYDLPAMIDYILLHTGERHLHYVGFCQGATAFFVMASHHPNYNTKIWSMHALAPVVFMASSRSEFFRIMAPFMLNKKASQQLFGKKEFLGTATIVGLSGSNLCRKKSSFQPLCSNILFLIAGYGNENLKSDLASEIVKITPAGASVHEIRHLAQNVFSGKFQHFDLGKFKNWMKYQSLHPPEYHLTKVTAPVHIYYAENDWLAATKDIELLEKQLINVVYKKEVSARVFNHLDFLFANSAYELVYSELLDNLKKYK